MTISHTFPFSTPTARTTSIAAQAIAGAAAYNGSEIDADSDEWLDIAVTWQYGVAPTANAPLSVYLVYAADGTNYDDVSYYFVGQVGVGANTNTHYKSFVRVPLGASKFKIRVLNGDAAQSATVTVTAKSYKQAVEPV
jgi:hypothetical protein